MSNSEFRNQNSELNEKQWYICDPERNPGCGKHNCWLWGNWNCCMITSRPESARLDKNGEPIRVRILRTPHGFSLEVMNNNRPD